MEIQNHTEVIFQGIQNIIEKVRTKVSTFLNTETTLLNWQIGNYINQQLIQKNRTDYGDKIIATLSQQLTLNYGKGYSYSALTRMCKMVCRQNAQVFGNC